MDTSFALFMPFLGNRTLRLIFCAQRAARGPDLASRLRRQMRLSTIQYYQIIPHTVSTQRHPHGSTLDHQQQPFRTKFMVSEKENYIQKSKEMFYTLISSFEWIFPGNDRIQGHFLYFLTLNKSFGGWSPVCSSQQPSLLLM